MNKYLKETDLWSNEELELLEYFGYKDLVMCVSLDVSSLYNMMVSKAFLDGIENKYTKGLRVAYKSFAKCNPYRMTSEFNNLIRNELDKDLLCH